MGKKLSKTRSESEMHTRLEVHIAESESQQGNIIRQLEEIKNSHLKQMKESLDSIYRVLYGDGADAPGMKTRIDRLEQSEARQDRLFWLVSSGVIMMLIERIFTLAIK